MTIERVALESAQHSRILEYVNRLLVVNADQVSKRQCEPNWPINFSEMKELNPEFGAIPEDELFLYLARRGYPESVAMQGINRIINTIIDISGGSRVKSIDQSFSQIQQTLQLPKGWQQIEVQQTSFEGKIKVGRKTLELTKDLHHWSVETYTHGIDMNAGMRDVARFTFTNNRPSLSADYASPSVPNIYTNAPYTDLEEVLIKAAS